MPQQIIWSHFAENDFANIPDYLDRNLDRKVETARSSTEDWQKSQHHEMDST